MLCHTTMTTMGAQCGASRFRLTACRLHECNSWTHFSHIIIISMHNSCGKWQQFWKGVHNGCFSCLWLCASVCEAWASVRSGFFSFDHLLVDAEMKIGSAKSAPKMPSIKMVLLHVDGIRNRHGENSSTIYANFMALVHRVPLQLP